MSWLRVLTALGILVVAASALLLFARFTGTATGSTGSTGSTGNARNRNDRAPDIRTDAEGSGLFPRLGGDKE
ncbi:hypothetical protein [Streptomyces sp. NRRL WC-3742]|uniref:hypothetical protein n=1 Tax=Streptomyces sp. NRRL WC-3742 TaxID=1463934 RepID=UPI0004CC2158|nr:hypothetical protein [Streptomyces sp. NRRL WC-3742]